MSYNEQVRANLRLLDFSDTRHVGCVRPQANNTYEHEKFKFDKAFECAKKEHVKVLEKYINMWEPVNFVTKKDVEDIVKNMLKKK